MPSGRAHALDRLASQFAWEFIITHGGIHCHISGIKAAIQLTIRRVHIEAEGFPPLVTCIVQVLRHPGLSVNDDCFVYLAVARVPHCTIFDVRVKLFTLFFQVRLDIHLGVSFR